MKKGLLFATALMTGIAAFAAQPTLSNEALKATKVSATPGVATMAVRADVSPKDVTEATKAIITLPSNLFYSGLSDDGYSLKNNIGIASAYENYTFKSASTGVNKLSWSYPDVWTGFDADRNIPELNSDAESITYSAPAGVFPGPSLTVFGPNYIDQIDLEVDPQYPVEILYGGGTSFISSQRTYGLTTISRMTVPSPDGRDGNFSRGHVLGYDISKDSDVNKDWGNYVTQVETAADSTSTVSDVVYSGFGNIFPAPASPYLIQNVWAWCYAQFKGAGTLTLKVCTLDENDQPVEVLAKGTCDYTKDSESGVFNFPIKSVDEFGFEIDEPLMIDQRVAFIITDLDKDPNITTLMPLWATGYAYNADEANPFEGEVYNCNIIKYDLNGKSVESNFSSPWNYYSDATRTTLMAVTSYTFFTDAVFGFCVEEGTKLAGDIHRGVDEGGEEFEITLESLYSIADDEISVSDDSWVSVELGAYNQQTGLQTLSILADPLDGKEGNSCVITINAYAAEPLHIILGQGTLAVEGVSANKEVVASKYFDLQGRELKGQPESGFVIRKDIKADGTSTVVKTVL